MENNRLTPCPAWEEKLAALHPADLSPALEAHIASCSACAATRARYQKMDDLLRASLVDDPLEANPDWLMQDDLAGQLPPLPARGQQYHNLPPRPEELLGREEELAEILKVLGSFESLIAIEGVSGVGKTTLALEIAHRCLQSPDPLSPPLFDTVVWISARGRPEQRRWLSETLATIARVLDYPAAAQLRIEEKRTRVRELLRVHQSLIVIDNVDTIHDPWLFEWLQQIPHSSKALVTSRTTEHLQMAWTLHLEGLKGDEALGLIRSHARKLSLAEIERAGPSKLLNLVHVTSGNPQAIVMALGNIKNRGLSLRQALKEMPKPDEIFVHLFTRSWTALAGNPDAQRALLVMPFFASSASSKAIGAAAGIEDESLELALKRLVELSLLEVYNNRDGTKTRYSIHPLTRASIGEWLKEAPEWEQKARERWIQWWLAFTKEHGGEDGVEWAQQYNLLEAEWENLLVVCQFCATHDQYEALRAFWSSTRLLGMTSIYGYWKERVYWLRWIRQEAERRGDWTAAIESMAEQGFTIAQMGGVGEAWDVLNQAWERANNQQHLVSPGVLMTLAEHIVQWHIRINDFARAKEWLQTADKLLAALVLSESERPRHELTIKYYYGVISLEKLERNQAEIYFEEVLSGAQKIGWQRGTVYAQQFLGDIARARGKFDKAEELLKSGLVVAERNKDKRRTAYYKRSLAYLALQRDRRNRTDEAITWAQKALDDFERLDMKPEVKKLLHLVQHFRATSRVIPRFVENVYSSKDDLAALSEKYPTIQPR